MEYSCIPLTAHGENLQVEGHKNTTNVVPVGKRPSSRRTCSLSSSSSFKSSSSFGSSSFDDPLLSGSITPPRFSGIPFSWEQHPGIPKKYLNSPSSTLLPLPPPPPNPTPSNPTPSKRFNLEPILPTQKKNNPDQNFHIDPFVTALVECSKDRRREGLENCWKGSAKVPRTLSDRLGFIDFYASCKNSCAVSDSTVFIPRSSRRNYLLKRRTG